MKKIKYILLLLATIALAAAANAQVINGDLNHNNQLDPADVTQLIDSYLTGKAEVITGVGSTPFYADNSLIVGTWYRSATESITFSDDGTTDFGNGYTYEFLPVQGYVVFYNASGVPTYALRVLKAMSDQLMFLPASSSVPEVYTSARPVSITLSQTSLEMKPDEFTRLTATVVPSDAGTVTWSSSNESVATVISGFVTAVSDGTAVITASVGSASAACTVTVASKPMNNGHEYVDLGLSVKWATMNVGASSPEDYGDYFAWGETTTKATYDWSTYKWCNGSYNSLTKYCTSSIFGTVDNKAVLDLSDDAARANWGGTWRMPTDAELTELRTQCTWTWTTQNGVNGYKVTSKTNSNSVFLPAAGYRYDTSLSNAGSYGYYWSSSLNESAPIYAWYVSFNSGGVYADYSNRCSGQSVRPVCQ